MFIVDVLTFDVILQNTYFYVISPTLLVHKLIKYGNLCPLIPLYPLLPIFLQRKKKWIRASFKWYQFHNAIPTPFMSLTLYSHYTMMSCLCLLVVILWDWWFSSLLSWSVGPSKFIMPICYPHCMRFHTQLVSSLPLFIFK